MTDEINHKKYKWYKIIKNEKLVLGNEKTLKEI